MNTYLLGGAATSVIRIAPISRLTFSFAFVYSVVVSRCVFFFSSALLYSILFVLFFCITTGNIVIFAFMALSSVYCECAPVWIFAPHTIYSMKCVYILKYGLHHGVNTCKMCILEFRMFLLLAGHFFFFSSFSFSPISLNCFQFIHLSVICCLQFKIFAHNSWIDTEINWNKHHAYDSFCWIQVQ